MESSSGGGELVCMGMGRRQRNGPGPHSIITSRMALIRSVVDRLTNPYELLRVRCGSRGGDWAAGASAVEAAGWGAMAGLGLFRAIWIVSWPCWCRSGAFGTEMPRAAKVGKRACSRARSVLLTGPLAGRAGRACYRGFEVRRRDRTMVVSCRAMASVGVLV